ncbi:DUF456 domain-containing protein [Occultella glacieicola]|nr:DUF456 domain-containing protein [Occultella glacieicola]
MSGLEVICALIMVVGLFGVVVQVLPGSLIVLGAVLLWAIVTGGGAWWVFVIGVLAVVAAGVGKYLLAGRGLKRAGVPNSTLVWGGIAGVIGFFVVPVVGLPLFFVFAVFLAEWIRLRELARAWSSTKSALKATGVTILVELAGAMIAIGAWVAGVIAT